MAVGLMLSLGLVSKKLPFWLGLTGPEGVGLGPGKKKKIRLVNGLGPGRESWPEGRVRVCKNLARTQSVAIPPEKL